MSDLTHGCVQPSRSTMRLHLLFKSVCAEDMVVTSPRFRFSLPLLPFFSLALCVFLPVQRA